MTAIKITVPAAFVTAAMAAVSKEETRYYLKGVFFDARGFIAATNGHIAFAARCTDAAKLADVRPAYDSAGACLPGVIVPDAALKAVLKGKDDDVIVDRDDNGLWWLTRGALRTHFAPVDGSFPDWTRVIPQAPETETAAHYQPQHVRALGDMAQALRGGKKDMASCYHIHQAGEGPALVTFPREVTKLTDAAGPRQDCCAVVMPMRAYKGADVAFDHKAFFASV